MMTTIDNGNGKVSWGTLSIFGTMAAAIVVGAIWLGSLSNQVSVNSTRLNKLEIFADDVRQHDANTIAEQRGQDRRLDALESKITK